MNVFSISFICALFLFCANVNADEWIADPDTGCKVFNPKPLPNESIKYSGQCEIGKANGQGSVIWYTNQKPTSREYGIYKDGVNVTSNLSERGFKLFSEGKVKESIDVLEKAAKQGGTNAILRLGEIYLLGLGGIPTDKRKAIKYYEQAANQGNPAAINNIAGHYYRGDGVVKDVNKSAKLFMEAYKNDLSKALAMSDGKTAYSISKEFLDYMIINNMITDPKLREEVLQALAN